MPTFKNIRVPVGKSGKTRLQRVQVLKSGKFKFVKNIGKRVSRRKKTTKKSVSRRKKRGNPSKSVRKTAKGKFFGNLSGAGALEDVAWGTIGFSVLGRSATAIPMTRAIQGIAAHALDRRGKARMIPGILDLISIWLAGGFGANGGVGLGGIASALQNLRKMSPLFP